MPKRRGSSSSNVSIKQTVRHLEKVLATLKKYEDMETVEPEVNCLYRTLNGSVVYVYRPDNDFDDLDDEDEFNCVVLKGGHKNKMSYSDGAEPPETYTVDSRGVFKNDYPCPEMVMSLKEKIEVII